MAIAPAVSPSTFPLFSSFPAELRDQIWQESLPEKIRPALHFYKKGCWCPRRLSESDNAYDAENDENNLNFEFRHDLLDNAEFDVPLAFVNHEARAIALAWIREQGIEIRRRGDRQFPIFVRPFDPAHDALYVPLDKWDDFLREPDDRLFQPDLFEKRVDIEPRITRIAVSETLLRSEVATLPDMFQYFFHLEVLFIVVDAQPDQLAVESVKAQRRWEFESTQGGTFVWNSGRGGFDLQDSEYTRDEALYKLVEEANQGLGEGLAQNDISSFEIRPILAIKR